ncbi:unnamed protein product [Prorocentrum cordatum]|uniref:Uncharacterized protein n=1 Tax=Prorocentrum cordatum TaxID=2364126 RepID=A0ABN9Q8F9_9DINO|nr:unnamed protein product [Polarella glacialis]
MRPSRKIHQPPDPPAQGAGSGHGPAGGACGPREAAGASWGAAAGKAPAVQARHGGAAGHTTCAQVVFTHELDQLVFGSDGGEAAVGAVGPPISTTKGAHLSAASAPVATKIPWRREAQEPTGGGKLREQILQHRQEFEKAAEEGVSEPAAKACSAASEASAETAPEVEKVKIWRCPDLKCKARPSGFESTTGSAMQVPLLMSWGSTRAIQAKAMPKPKMHQEGNSMEESEEQLVMNEGRMMLAAERDTLRAVRYLLEKEKESIAQSVPVRRLDSVLPSHPATSSSGMAPAKRNNRWSSQPEAVVESLFDQAMRSWCGGAESFMIAAVSTDGNAKDLKNFKDKCAAELSVFGDLDSLGDGMNNGEDDEDDHGPNPVGAGLLYGHVGGGGSGSDVHDPDDE